MKFKKTLTIALAIALLSWVTCTAFAAGGGVSSNYYPLDVAQYTFEELKAAVDVAKS